MTEEGQGESRNQAFRAGEWVTIGSAAVVVVSILGSVIFMGIRIGDIHEHTKILPLMKEELTHIDETLLQIDQDLRQISENLPKILKGLVEATDAGDVFYGSEVQITPKGESLLPSSVKDKIQVLVDKNPEISAVELMETFDRGPQRIEWAALAQKKNVSAEHIFVVTWVYASQLKRQRRESE